MNKIQSYPFSRMHLSEIRGAQYGVNWPVVYLIEDGKELYVGQTVNLYNRSKQHLDNPERARLHEIHVVSDDDFNKSAALDIESWLIQYFLADGRFVLQNGNSGLQNHNYYQRSHYEEKFQEIWEEICERGLAQKSLRELKNSDLFKYSPYKTLNDEQYLVAESILQNIESLERGTFLVHGRPGTGKTILAVYLVKYLLEKAATKDLKIGLVVPMTSLRNTLKKVFKSIKGLKASMVLSPNDVVKQQYDLLIIDEAHRLMRRKNITNYKSFDDVNKSLGLSTEGHQLDWIMASSRYQVFFYDDQQSVKPSDIPADQFKELALNGEFRLDLQMRVEGGEDYIHFIESLFHSAESSKILFENYDFRIFDDVHQMVEEVKKKDREIGLSRIVAGYAWDWRTKHPGNRDGFDIEIEGTKLKWNSVASDWVNSPNAINEVGCIHTVQGYDLNYVGVIVGPELSYDIENNRLKVIKENYKDKNGKRGVGDIEDLQRYILNIYKTLLTRGVKGCYVYFVDKDLERFFRMRAGI